MKRRYFGVILGSVVAAAGAVPQWRTELGARLIRATLLVDRANDRLEYVFTRLRIALVLAFATDDMLERYGQLGYRSMDRYRPDKSSFVGDLFPWEATVIERFFPDPPGRVLIGGAGGGREPFALATMGYDIVAFDPVPELVRGMAEHTPVGASVDGYQAKYEDLPRLRSLQPGATEISVQELPPFDAGILGWGSFSHLRNDESRVHALSQMARVVSGPILVSFFWRPSEEDRKPSALHWLRHKLPGRNRTPGNTFSIQVGPYREFTECEFGALVNRAGLSIDFLEIGERFTSYSHAVLSARAR